MFQTLLFKAEILPEFKVSTNKIYSGLHYRQRKKIKDSLFEYYRLIVKASKIKPIEDMAIKLKFVFYFKSRALDASNCSYMGKMIEDTFVKTGILKDDSPKYIRSVEYESKKNNKDKKDLVEVYVVD